MAAGSAVTIRPPFDVRAKAATARSMSLLWRTSIAATCTPIDGARAWIAAKYPIPAVIMGSRRTATRVTCGGGKSRGVPFGLCQTCDIAATDRICDVYEHDRHGAARLL